MTDPTPKPLAPLVTDEQIVLAANAIPGFPTPWAAARDAATEVRDIYEASRAKDHDLMREAADTIKRLTRIVDQLHFEVMHLPQASIEKMTAQQFNFLYTKESGPLHDAKELVPTVRALLTSLTSLTERINTH